ncbi:NAD(P)-dependent dehydrogenase (short-subunit alcohol dehydrogenase family) [Roseiarcus fermentans]|uniref:NAD(P)-dependent dehydrogenase (Short-subunit alcohol dehydrogenase family) n=1 Tax=Roseiarcus fermentans TaxID=1473586 RepID=A0A366F5H2_9HYPH|nr:SDR family NAD(P)-dependent oxidoreductase [Roseiarcus fermentans]RBP09898.1 NAD(P)-dependent dehydrogenase (short-subunit alcohol dehydrogenase family) [Roseiarcus fermentans]
MRASLLHGKVAVVTAAGSGIGRASATILAENGAHVVATDRDAAAAEATRAAIVAKGFIATAQALDVTDEGAVVSLFERTAREKGGLHILHNHAGIQIAGALEQIDSSDMRKSYEVNVVAQFSACRAALPHMRAQGGGVILNTASNAGVFLDRGMLAYITTKSAVIAMTKQIALEYARDGIRVNAICPGWVDTPFNGPYEKQLGGRLALEKVVRDVVPMGRFGLPEEIAEAILFLCSERSAFVTGHALVVDGGECLAGGSNSSV